MRQLPTRPHGKLRNTSAAADARSPTAAQLQRNDRMTTISLHLQLAAGELRRITGRTGRSLMQAAVDAGIDGIAADCGGCLNCATCHVFIDEAWLARLPPATGDEAAMLEMTAVPQEPNSRLSCQIVLQPELDGLTLRLPARQY